MADVKLSALPAVTTPLAGTEQIETVQSATSKMVTLNQVRDLLGIYKASVTGDHAISTIAGTEVALSPVPTLPAGTYQFLFALIVQSATLTVSPLYGVNFTGTTTLRNMHLRIADAGPLTAGTMTADEVGPAAFAGQPLSGMAQNAFSTTAPNMGHAGGVGAINANTLVFIEGVFVATGAGDLELWHGSETATSTTVKAGSALTVAKVA